MSIFSPHMLLDYLFSFNFAHAALVTLWISLASLLCGMLIGLTLAAGQEVPSRAVRGVIMFYLWLYRGTPVLLQLVFAFNVLPLFGIVLPAYACAVLALGLNEGAYMTEIMRSGIRAVGPGQRVAARALGMEERQIMLWVVLPQALRIVIPPIGNQFNGMLKLSALVSVIGVQELLLIADQTASMNFRFLETLTVAGLYYLAMTTVLMIIQGFIEQLCQRRRGRTPVRSAFRLLSPANLGIVR
ncbi:MAG: amino acid ABC transporter permease [Alphaproteobacteria bacterium]|nr:amino acid ABC transporter permease [Alphaproteobacteria bacterium]